MLPPGSVILWLLLEGIESRGMDTSLFYLFKLKGIQVVFMKHEFGVLEHARNRVSDSSVGMAGGTGSAEGEHVVKLKTHMPPCWGSI